MSKWIVSQLKNINQEHFALRFIPAVILAQIILLYLVAR